MQATLRGNPISCRDHACYSRQGGGHNAAQAYQVDDQTRQIPAMVSYRTTIHCRGHQTVQHKSSECHLSLDCHSSLSRHRLRDPRRCYYAQASSGMFGLFYIRRNEMKLTQVDHGPERANLASMHRPNVRPKASSVRSPSDRHRKGSPAPIRDFVLSRLSVITHFEHKASGIKISKRRGHHFRREDIRSAGLPYCAILIALRRRMPQSRAAAGTLRVIAHFARTKVPGFEHCQLPQVRPHGTRTEARRIAPVAIGPRANSISGTGRPSSYNTDRRRVPRRPLRRFRIKGHR